ncbi:hypothetical protein AAFF_G00131350 [Aldrovandia affinis]|uniref:Uncharacterized protein n=1 Tax=Aldrovandia affinis TaxID=143900 RepID=A0AAD7RQS6_9TELE|nr:hypothetical protein AAFF_G00131350 [Aldrovandia affinis]
MSVPSAGSSSCVAAELKLTSEPRSPVCAQRSSRGRSSSGTEWRKEPGLLESSRSVVPVTEAPVLVWSRDLSAAWTFWAKRQNMLS